MSNKTVKSNSIFVLNLLLKEKRNKREIQRKGIQELSQNCLPFLVLDIGHKL